MLRTVLSRSALSLSTVRGFPSLVSSPHAVRSFATGFNGKFQLRRQVQEETEDDIEQETEDPKEVQQRLDRANVLGLNLIEFSQLDKSEQEEYLSEMEETVEKNIAGIVDAMDEQTLAEQLENEEGLDEDGEPIDEELERRMEIEFSAEDEREPPTTFESTDEVVDQSERAVLDQLHKMIANMSESQKNVFRQMDEQQQQQFLIERMQKFHLHQQQQNKHKRKDLELRFHDPTIPDRRDEWMADVRPFPKVPVLRNDDDVYNASPIHQFLHLERLWSAKLFVEKEKKRIQKEHDRTYRDLKALVSTFEIPKDTDATIAAYKKDPTNNYSTQWMHDMFAYIVNQLNGQHTWSQREKEDCLRTAYKEFMKIHTSIQADKTRKIPKLVPRIPPARQRILNRATIHRLPKPKETMY